MDNVQSQRNGHLFDNTAHVLIAHPVTSVIHVGDTPLFVPHLDTITIEAVTDLQRKGLLILVHIKTSFFVLTLVKY